MRFAKKQWLLLTTIFTLLLSLVLPGFSSGVAAAPYITVAEAIANNSGTATVKGYIVGYAKSGSSYETVAPFKDDTNFGIADSATETDSTKILPVQITSGYRAEFGLKSNPGNLGKEVFVTGSLEKYFGVPGLKSPSLMSFDGEAGPVDPPVDPPGESVRISSIQGETHTSPFKDKNVKDVEGVVTQVMDSANFYMQDPNPDNNPKTSEGILVYKPSHGLVPGDLVSVNGLVKEWVIAGYNDKLETDLPSTEINAQNGTITKKASGHALPPALVIGKDINPPTQIVDNDKFEVFDPNEDAIDFYESIEGMRVAVENPTAVAPQKYGEVPVIAGKIAGKTYTTPGGVPISENNMNPERLHLLFDDETFVSKTGDTFNGTVTGVITYTFQNYKILTDTSALPPLVESDYAQEVTDIVKDDEKLTVATYNMENYTSANAAKTNKIAESIVENLNIPDIVGLVEVQDNNGESAGGTAADQNYQALIDAIKAHGGPTYKWTDIEPANNQDGGAPNGNIRVGYIYNPERVTLKAGTKGTAEQAVGYEDGALTLNPGRIDPANDAFAQSRKPLAAQFTFNGEDVIVINNHFNSKGGDQPIFGKNQPPVLGSEAQRMAIAGVVNEFVDDVKSKNPDANIVVMGDLNDFEFSNPLQALKGDVLTNLIEKVPAAERFTYNYQGNSQVLDHLLVSNNLANGAEIDIVHINSPFMESHGRVSDHDPILAQLDLGGEKPTDEFNLSILHVNDTHANVQQYPKLTSVVKEVRGEKANSLLVDAGDVFSGTLYFNQYQGKADLWFMNNLGYDAMTFGNHEFDKDSNVLASFIKEAQFPFVSANVNVSKDPVLGALFSDELNTASEGGKIYPAIIKEVDGEKVGIFGLTTEDTTFLASPSDDIVFENAIEKAEQTVAALEEQGINKIVVLSHLGYGQDQELAEAVDGVDVIVGGHTHTKLDQPVVVEKDEPTVIVQANEYLKFLGVLDVTFDNNGVVIAHEGELLDVNSFTEDEEAAAKVAEFTGPLEELKKTVVGSTSVVLDGERANVRSKETNLGNLITDAMVEKANSMVPGTFIGMQNGGGIRASIDEGDVTLGEIHTVMPFANLLVTLDLTGAEILAALEHSVSKVESGAGQFMQVSGIQFKYDTAKPAGERVWEVKVLTAEGYAELDLTKTYSVATNAFVADGGDGYTMFKQAKDEGRIHELLIVDYEILTGYFEKNSPVFPKVEGRIVAGEEPFNLSIMHVNDSHANVEQYPKLTSAVKEVRGEKPNSLLVDAGDVFSGTLYFNQYQGKADLWFMNNLGYDAMTFGNHEFDKDSNVLASFIKEAQFPFVSANVNVSKDPVLGALFSDELNTASEGGKIYPAIIKEVDGEKVGIFGLTTEDTTFLASPSDDIVFENAIEKAEQTVAALEEQGINKIVVLSHLGYGQDQELAEAVDGVDVIVGGHTHTKLDQPVVVEKDEPTVIVQANEYLKFLGVLDVTFDNNGVVIAHEGELLDVNSFTEDEEAAAKVAEFTGPLEELKKTVVGSTSVVLDGERANVRSKETNLGNLITDAMVEKANSMVPGTFIGMQNGGGIRASIDEGDVTLGEIHTVMPFANLLVTLDLTGAEILAALEHSVSKVESGAGQFMQVSGIQFKYDPAKPAGERVWDVKVLTAEGYAELDLTKTYSVATNAFVADGGDGYTMFKQAKDEGRIHELMIVDYEILVEYFGKHSPVAPGVEGRIVADVEPVDNGGPGDNDGPGDTDGPGDGGTIVNPPSKGGKTTTPSNPLPNTATNSYNIMLLGFLIAAFGVTWYIRKRRINA
ncbi:5'-nucleotidase C-terminal domain-containing protein [Neobacillus niacini]|uniref:5'-nucleotidase C-terminal domain-containing protein n=1 Tax=Neobacillus niacini TaxID=86668 RepID=UPI003983BCA7